MPRRAILSDIHGNLVALERALADCDEQRVDEIVCIGDIVGYGPDPIECVDRIRARSQWCLCGNHDVALFMVHAVGFNKIAKQAIEYQKRVLRPHWYSLPKKIKRWNWLEALSSRRLEANVLYVHASPRDPLTEYVDEGDVADMGFGPSDKIVEIFEQIPWLCFCGHSHKPGVVTQDFLWIHPRQLDEYRYELPKDEKTLVNVGSVGQPRDHIPDLCYVIFDSERRLIQFRRIAYDIPAAQERFQRVKALHEKCWQRLTDGI